MIIASNTTRIMIASGAMDKADAPKETRFEMAGESHAFVLDGQVETAIQSAMIDPERAFTNIGELTQLCKDESGALAKTRNLLADGAETVKIDVGKGEKWTARNADKPGTIELLNGGGLHGDEQTIRVSDGYVSLRTRASYHQDENVTQKIVGKWNAGQGTITCVNEEIERVVPFTAPAAPPPAPPPPAQKPRPGTVTTDLRVDAKVFDPVQKEIGGDRVFTGLDDPRLQRFADWALGRIDLPIGRPLNGLPEGWEARDESGYRSIGEGDNYIVSGRESYQVLNVNRETETVTLRTSHEYRRPTDFEGSHDELTLTRYADGEVRREYHEMHD